MGVVYGRLSSEERAPMMLMRRDGRAIRAMARLLGRDAEAASLNAARPSRAGRCPPALTVVIEVVIEGLMIGRAADVAGSMRLTPSGHGESPAAGRVRRSTLAGYIRRQSGRPSFLRFSTMRSRVAGENTMACRNVTPVRSG